MFLKLWSELIVAVSVSLRELLPAQFATRLRIYLAPDADVTHPPTPAFSVFVLRPEPYDN
jgi:hypothetical protein